MHQPLDGLRVCARVCVFCMLTVLSGVIVVHEEVPLLHAIPHSEFIIFCPYDTLFGTVAKVHRNYNKYFRRIHGPDSRLR